MDAHPRTAISLFSGVGGLDLGLRIAIPGLRTVLYVEREAYAASILVARMESQALDNAPVWDDVSTCDFGRFHGLVDIISGGFPCQDLSVAGKGAGITGERSGLWTEFRRAISEVRPREVFIENVAALAIRGLDTVLSDLAGLGYDAEWMCLRASDVGAPHQRHRMFIHAREMEHTDRESRRAEHELQPEGQTGESGGTGEAVANAKCPERWPQHDPRGTARQHDVPQGEEGSGGPWVGSEELANPKPEQSGGEFPPGPNGDWSEIPEWLHPAVEPGLRVRLDGFSYVVDASRGEQLRCLGNGAVPLQAAAAYRILDRRF